MKRWFGLSLLLVACAGFTGASAQTSASNINELSLEVAALHLLHDLELSLPQLDELIKLARDCAAKPPSSQAKVSSAYRAALAQLRTALIKSEDEKIAELMEKLDQIHEKEELELDTAVEITPTARQKAAAAVQVLSVRQLAVLIGTLELAEPSELLVEGLAQIRTVKEDKDDEMEQIAEEVSTAAGMDEEATKKLKDQAIALLKKASEMKDDVFKRQKAALEKQARQLVGKFDPVVALNRSVEHGMAEFLSNPRCEMALKSMRARRSVVPLAPKAETKAKKKAV
jgi:hypothetical protein